ncbi:MAG: hypothetical protein ABJA79_10350, partial [Parafilimonas sp.]
FKVLNMQAKFDKKGNLQADLILRFDEFQKLFGYNAEREKKINTLFTITKSLAEFGCNEMYVVGSFVTNKQQPNDIDVCFDITSLDEKAFESAHQELLNSDALERIHELLKVHIIYYTSYDTEIVNWFRFDRDGNKRGIIKISLKDIHGYDKE